MRKKKCGMGGLTLYRKGLWRYENNDKEKYEKYAELIAERKE